MPEVTGSQEKCGIWRECLDDARKRPLHLAAQALRLDEGAVRPVGDREGLFAAGAFLVAYAHLALGFGL